VPDGRVDLWGYNGVAQELGRDEVAVFDDTRMSDSVGKQE
jgi:hypothetical protein